jgi:hypothetical protein
MKPGPLVRLLAVIGVTVLAMSGPASAADVRVMISSGFHSVYSELAPVFERASGHRLVTTRGPSMGDSLESIPTRLARGEAADVAILDGSAVDALGSKGLLRADSKVEFARSLIGMVVLSGAVKPDIGSVEAFRNTLLAAKSIAYSDSGSGTYLSTKLSRTAGRRAGGQGGRARRGRDRLPASQRADPCRRRDLCRHDSGRTAARFRIRRRAHKFSAAARGGQCAAPLPRFAGSCTCDRKGRTVATHAAIVGDQTPHPAGTPARNSSTSTRMFSL